MAPPEVRAEAFGRTHGICAACLVKAGCDPYAWRTMQVFEGRHHRATDLHHVLPRQKWPDLIENPDNLIGVCRQCHLDHEFSPDRRIPEQAIPDCAARLAWQTGPAAWEYLVAHYPSLPKPE